MGRNEEELSLYQGTIHPSLVLNILIAGYSPMGLTHFTMNSFGVKCKTIKLLLNDIRVKTVEANLPVLVFLGFHNNCYTHKPGGLK